MWLAREWVVALGLGLAAAAQACSSGGSTSPSSTTGGAAGSGGAAAAGGTGGVGATTSGGGSGGGTGGGSAGDGGGGDAATASCDEKSKPCVSAFGSLFTKSNGRADGTLVALVRPVDLSCAMPNATHVTLELSILGQVQRLVASKTRTH